MKTNNKKKKRDSKRKSLQSEVVKTTIDYSKDPFVIKKTAESKKFLEEHGFPEEIMKWLKK